MRSSLKVPTALSTNSIQAGGEGEGWYCSVNHVATLSSFCNVMQVSFTCPMTYKCVEEVYIFELVIRTGNEFSTTLCVLFRTWGNKSFMCIMFLSQLDHLMLKPLDVIVGFNNKCMLQGSTC